jgi:SAM-dependent methyltransferase
VRIKSEYHHKNLKFLDGSFNTVTSLFTLMYINGWDHEKVFSEIFRVLKNQGRFFIWDVVVLKIKNGSKDRFMIPLKIKLPDREIQTGYGGRKPEVDHELDYYVLLAEKTGFKVLTKRKTERTFFLELIKP